MPSENRSELFGVQSHSQYFSWVPVKDGIIPDDAVSIEGPSGEFFIGRTKRNDNFIVPGVFRDGVLRFLFEGEWQEEKENIEIMKDNFGSARQALSWIPTEAKDDVTVLSLDSVICGEFPNGLYLIGRKKNSMELIPVAIKPEQRKFDEGQINYQGEPLVDIEILASSYHRFLAICPPAPLGPEDEKS